MSRLPVTVVVAALIWRDDALLVQQRRAAGAHGNLWEFPGGKVEPGESDVEALRREAREELAVELKVGALFWTTLCTDGSTRLDLRVYAAHIPEGQAPSCLAAQRQIWAPLWRLETLAFCPADIDLVGGLAAGHLRPPLVG